jgi:hypothetical protein
MSRVHLRAVRFCVILVLVAGSRTAHTQRSTAQPWRQSFSAAPEDLATTGENPYFILKPGYVLTLEGKEDGKPVRLVVTVLNETKNVGGVETRVVEERETQAGVLAEVSRNYFAIEKGSNNVYYFGEDVDVYRNGKVVGHEGAWLHGANGAKFGLMMPGTPAVGARYYQELAPGVAMDRAQVVSLSERLTTPAGTFQKCLKTEETTPLEPGAREFKLYAPGVGLIKDGDLELVKIESVKP